MRFEYRELLNFYPTIFHKALYISPELISEYKELIENVENERIRMELKLYFFKKIVILTYFY